MREELRLEPVQNNPPAEAKQSAAIIAGRVVDATTNASVSHAGVSLAEGLTLSHRRQWYSQIRLTTPFLIEVSVCRSKKTGCTP